MTTRTLIGRARERAVFDLALDSAEAELIVVLGRRRVGKTFLVRELLADRIVFELTGIHQAALSTQLANVHAALRATDPKWRESSPADWRTAFEHLARALSARRATRQKRVVFIDEFPWLASPRSKFLASFEHFWNSWAVKQPDLVVVVCGSAAGWMSRNLLAAGGGLHNRVTRRIRLEPFTLAETEEYLRSRHIDLGRFGIVELYAALGGIPYYLRQVERGDSPTTAIERTCFARDGALHDEFRQLYASLFEHPDRHVAIVRALASKPHGMTRSELVAEADLGSGGTVTRTLEELEESGFLLRTPQPKRSKKDAIFRVADEYSLFYLRWIEQHRSRSQGVWATRRGTPAWRAWVGYAFEGICAKHVDAIKRALGVGAVETIEYSWYVRARSRSERGAQIDLVIDRRDGTMNICEMKFSEAPFTVDKGYAADLRAKGDAFRTATASRKAIVLTMITTYGVKSNAYATELVDKSLEIDALFG